MKKMEDHTFGATDGIIGRVNDFYLDDEARGIRYLMVEAADGSAGRQVRISPIGLGKPNWTEKILSISTEEQVVEVHDHIRQCLVA